MIKHQRELTLEEKNEIAGLAVSGGETAEIPADLPATEKAARIKTFLDTPEGIDDEQARTLAFTMGSLYGVLIEQNYGWKWAAIRFEDEEERYAVVSPDSRFAIAVHELFFNHLTGEKECRFVLLFSLLGKELPKSSGPGITLLA